MIDIDAINDELSRRHEDFRVYAPSYQSEFVTIRDEDGVFIANTKCPLTADVVILIHRVWMEAFNAGRTRGEDNVRSELRSMLGIEQ